MMRFEPIPIGALESAQPSRSETGFGALRTRAGNLPLKRMRVQATIVGVFAQTTVEQTFKNPTNQPLEAVYIFPLPERASVNGFVMTIGDRRIEGVLKEREQARTEYYQAIEEGHRAALAEQERPNIFTISVGNLMPDEEAAIRITLTGMLELNQGEATYWFPLVVAPRYVPGFPLDAEPVGDGYAPDTDIVPDASRITPPVLLPGFPNPVQLEIEAQIDGRTVSVRNLRCALHAVTVKDEAGVYTVRLQPDEALNRDFILRFELLDEQVTNRMVVVPDPDNPDAGTLLALVSAPAGVAPKPLNAIFLLDRSGSMTGWKMATARQIATALIWALPPQSRFALLAFDNELTPFSAGQMKLAEPKMCARAVQWMQDIEARGGTELFAALSYAIRIIQAELPDSDPVIVLITDGQVADEMRILQQAIRARARFFAVGVDEAINDALLRRLAEHTGGWFEPIESEERLTERLDILRQRLSVPMISNLRLTVQGIEVDPRSMVPRSPVNLYPRSVAYLMGRYRGQLTHALTAKVEGEHSDRTLWQAPLLPTVLHTPAVRDSWARLRVNLMDDLYAVAPSKRLERKIVEHSLQYGVLSRFTAFVAVDRSEVVNPGGRLHRIVQPVSLPRRWEMRMPAMGYCGYDNALASIAPYADRRAEPDYEDFALLSSPRERYYQFSYCKQTLKGAIPRGAAAVDNALQTIVRTLESWLEEHQNNDAHKALCREVETLLEAIQEHFELPWNQARVDALAQRCLELLERLEQAFEKPVRERRRRRFWFQR